ncbi:MAG: hypothetical protein ACE366_24395 [Bradymonadia bacterium]
MKQIIPGQSGAGHSSRRDPYHRGHRQAENRASPGELGRIEQLNAQSRSVYDEALWRTQRPVQRRSDVEAQRRPAEGS